MSEVAENPPRRVLIVRPSALGDVSRTVPALVTLRRAYPEAHIDWLVAEPFADVIRHHPMLDGVVPFARQRLRRFGLSPFATCQGLAFANRLRKARYDAVFDLQGLFRSGLFTWLTRAPKRVGFHNARELGWLGYNVRHHVDERQHAVDRMLALLEGHGLAAQRDMQLYVGPADERWLQTFSREHDVLPRQTICLAPTARWQSKCWPVRRYIELARRLIEQTLGPGKLVVLASPKEKPMIQPLLEALPAERVVAPRTTVGQMMALLSRTRLLVCNDSAPLHIAVGFNRPIVTMFGPTDPAKVGPYGRADAVVRPANPQPPKRSYRRHDDQALMAQIQVDQVWQAVQRQLARDAAK